MHRKQLTTNQEVKSVGNDTAIDIECRVSRAEGLVLRVMPVKRDGTVTKRWVFRYSRTIDGHKRRFRMPLGQYPQTSLETARADARELFVQASRGETPGLTRGAGTFAGFLDDYLAAQSKLVKIKERERELRKDAIPILGDMKPGEITPAKGHARPRRVGRRASAPILTLGCRI